MNLILEPKKKNKTNIFLKGQSPNISYEDILKLKEISDISIAEGQINGVNPADISMIANLSTISTDEITKVYSKYGKEGLFKLQFLIMAHKGEEFKHFYQIISEDLIFSELFKEEEELKLDNNTIPQNEKVHYFNTNILQPSFSRKIFNPGRHHGYLVYGVGGPKILISHPFQGINSKAEIYDIYNNSIDVVTSLILRGYHGTFMFLDYMPGLNFDVNGIPAWVIWFSVIASHSDLVIYVKEYEEEFGYSQKMELQFTSNLVQKKIVEIPHKELKWAKKEDVEFENYLYLGENGEMTQEEWYKMEAEHALPFIKHFVDLSFPKDRFILINEDRTINEFPLDFETYRDT